jgi:hypothetical protein
MIHRAALERDMASGDDIYGQPLPPDWQPVGVLPCRAYSTQAREVTDPGGETVIVDVRALFPRAADVRHGDRIVSISTRLAVVIWPGPFAVDTVVPRSDHHEVMLRRIT